VKQRKEFIDACIAEAGSMSELCRRFSVSRKTGYKWLHRYMGGCELDDRSRRPKVSPKAVSEWIEASIVAARKMRPTWGPRKLRASLQRSNPGLELPSVTTFALIFKRNGLIVPRRRKRRTTPSAQPLLHATGPNSLWCIDFKGDFLVGKARCYPLTITDAFSRYLIACVALPNTRFSGVFRAMVDVFDAFGLPAAIRSDNGSPCHLVRAIRRHPFAALCRELGISRQVGYRLVARYREARRDGSVMRIFDSAFQELGLPAAIRTDDGPPFASVGARGLTHLRVPLSGFSADRGSPGT
jgi:transposase InsO family protein